MLKQKQVELELLEVKLAQKSVAVAQERENNMAERQCVSVTYSIRTYHLLIIIIHSLCYEGHVLYMCIQESFKLNSEITTFQMWVGGIEIL